VDRPGPEPEHLHGWRLGQEARRHLQAGLAARPEDHLLPAHRNAADKRIINGQTDVNQLVPFKYKWAWEKYLATCANHWMPQEGEHVARHRDLERPERPDRRRAPHHQAQPRLLRHRRFAGRQQHRAGHLPPHHAPECRQFLLRQAFEEAIHTHAYQYIVESLGLDEGEIFNAYHEVPRSATRTSS
jgi:ribonucleoside-diphosphate reductase beta chain